MPVQPEGVVDHLVTVLTTSTHQGPDIQSRNHVQKLSIKYQFSLLVKVLVVTSKTRPGSEPSHQNLEECDKVGDKVSSSTKLLVNVKIGENHPLWDYRIISISIFLL